MGDQYTGNSPSICLNIPLHAAKMQALECDKHDAVLCDNSRHCLQTADTPGCCSLTSDIGKEY